MKWMAGQTVLSHVSADFSELLCVGILSLLPFRVHSELFIMCYYIMNILLPLENKQVYKVETKSFARNLWMA